MIEVQVENFQSIEKAAFQIDGFTALVGRSNIGKSALVRALRNALTGAPGTDFVRHGPSCERRLKENKKCKCQTTVRIVTPKLELVWEKGDAVNRYTVTRPGEPAVLYDKVDRGTPDFLRPDFSPVKVGDDQALIQVTEQFDPIFLLNMSGSTVADVLSDVARLDDINEAVRLVARDRKEASGTRTVREKDVAELARNLVTYEGLDVLVEDVQRIEARHAEVQAKEHQVTNVKRLFGELGNLARSIRSLQAATKAELPDDAKVQAVGERFRKAGLFLEGWKVRTAAVDRLSGLDAIDLPDLDQVEAKHKRFQQIDGCIRRAQAIKIDFERLKKLDVLPSPNHESLVAASERAMAAASLLGRLVSVGQAITTLQVQVAAAEQEEAEALEELRAMGTCPTCAQPLGSEQHLHLEAS